MTEYEDGAEDIEDEDDEEIDYEELDAIIEVFESLPWASPADLERIKNRLKKEKDLRLVLSSFKSIKRLEKSLAYGWLFLLGQIEYRAKTNSSVYVFVFGTRGMGKSEVGQHVALVIRQSYLKYLRRNHELAFGRSPTELNQLLKEATEEGISLVLISDEAERETGIGSATEEQALVGNLDTMRILMHSVIRCAIFLRWGFAARCDFILEPIYQDREAEVNYCVVYTIDPEKRKKVARFLIDIPLHDNQQLRDEYESWKKKAQEDFTSGGGRRSHLLARLEPIVQTMISVAKKRRLKPRSWKDFETILVFAVPDGESLTGRETALACRESFSRFTGGTEDKGEAPPFSGYEGQLDDMKEAVFTRLEELGFDPVNVDMLKRYADAVETQVDIGISYGVTQKTVSSRIRTLRLNPLALGGAFEDVYVKSLESEGYTVKQGGRNTPEPDALVYRDDQLIQVMSLKCYVDKRNSLTVPRSEIAEKEWEIAKANEVPLYIVFFDLVEGKLTIELVEDQQNFTFRKSRDWVQRMQRNVVMQREPLKKKTDD